MKQFNLNEFNSLVDSYQSLTPVKDQLKTKFAIRITDQFNQFDVLSSSVCNPQDFVMQYLAPLFAKLAPVLDFINSLSIKMHCIQDATNSPNIIPVTDFGEETSFSQIFKSPDFTLNYSKSEDYPYSSGIVDRKHNFTKTNIKKGTKQEYHQSGNFSFIDGKGNEMRKKKGNVHSTIEKSRNTVINQNDSSTIKKSRNTVIKQNDTSLVEKVISYYGKQKVHIGSDQEIHLEVGGVGIKIVQGKVYLQEDTVVQGNLQVQGNVSVQGDTSVQGDITTQGSVTDSRGSLTNFTTTDRSHRA